MATGASGGLLTRKVAGVPAWSIGAVVIVVFGYAWWKKRQAAAAAAAAPAGSGSATAGTATTPPVVPASDYGAPTGWGLSGGGGIPPWAQAPPTSATPPTPASPVPTAGTGSESLLGSGFGSMPMKTILAAIPTLLLAAVIATKSPRVIFAI